MSVVVVVEVDDGCRMMMTMRMVVLGLVVVVHLCRWL